MSVKVYYLHTMELAEAASGTTGLVLESDYEAKISELTQANSRLVEALKKIAENEHTMDDTTYCYLASKTLKELEIK
jgi:glutamine synthetase type III